MEAYLQNDNQENGDEELKLILPIRRKTSKYDHC